MKVEQVMTPSPATCGLTDNLGQVVERMWDANCGIIPVVDDAGHVLEGECEGRLCLRDGGPGIDPVNHERIFERFERAASTDLGGLGLGLYVTRQIVRAHGGTIAVESALGQGAVFTVELPRAREGAA